MESPQPPPAAADVVDLGLPIRTDRLVLRSGRRDDAASLHERRNQPAVQRFQSWTFPYAREDAESLAAALEEMVGPTFGEWWMLMVDLADGETVGDVAVHLDESGTIAEIGYNLSPEHWGNGYATEAVSAVIDGLFNANADLVRLQALVHPDNLASAAVVERCDLTFEGQTRLSYVPRDSSQEASDDRIYAMLRQDWIDWSRRASGQPKKVTLVEISANNVLDVCELTVHQSQDHLVAPVAHSLAQALVPPVRDGVALVPWYRAVEADGELVGFVMLTRPSEGRPEPYLMRMLTDRSHQRRGIGHRVLDLVVDQARIWGGSELQVSWLLGAGSPEAFYLRYGFESTGPPDDSGEVWGTLAI